MNSARNRLINDTIIYMIGNVLVALMQLVIMRCITRNISTEAYGYFNLIVTIDNLVTPFITLQISDAVFCYIIKEDDRGKRTVITNGILVIFTGVIVCTLCISIYSSLIYRIQYSGLVILYIVSTNIFAFYQKVSRAFGKNKAYVFSNLVKAVVYLLLQLFFIYVVHCEEKSLFLANILATFICIIILELAVETKNYFSFKYFDKKYLKKMLCFSLPLMPNAILWWLGNSVNSLVVSSTLGLEANGIYSSAGKFAALVSMFSSVFNLAWQESAVKEYGKAESGNFYSDTFCMFYRVVFSGVAFCMPTMYFLMPVLLDTNYQEAIKYAPILVTAAGIAAIYGFFGQMYAATEQTKGAFSTTVFGVICNLGVLFFTIRYLGLWSPCIALLASSLAIMIARIFQFRAVMKFQPEYKDILLLFILVICTIPYYVGNATLNALVLIICLVVAVYLNFGLLKDLHMALKEKIRIKKED